MRVRLIKKQTLEEYARENTAIWYSLHHWLGKIKYADWNMPEDIYNTFNSADLLGNGSNRVVFNLGGNKFRIIAKYWFGASNVHVYIKWAGTHAEYTRLCACGYQYTINKF